MKSFLKFLVCILTFALTFSHEATAGVQVYNSTTSIGVFSKVQCGTDGGLSCTKTGDTAVLTLGKTPSSVAPMKIWGPMWKPTVAADGTSTTPGATTVYLTQIYVPIATTLTGAAILNAATVGTNKYVFALFNSAGTALANTALAGVTTAGASVYQKIAFTATVTVVPGTYWIGTYVNGTTDRFYSIPTIGQAGGLAGTVTGQTFGTVANVTLPTTFTADVGPISYVY